MATDLKRGIRLLTPEPLDLRYVVSNEADRIASVTIGNYHDGILSFQQDTRTLWILKDGNWKQLYDEAETKALFVQNVGNQVLSGALALIPTDKPTEEGYIYYDTDLNIFKYTTDVPNLELSVGTSLYTRIVNTTGVTLTKGTAVYIDTAGAHVVVNEAAAVSKAIASEFDKSRVLGFVTTNIPNGEQGFAIKYGILKGIDLSAFSTGTVWLSADTAGGITETRPTGGNYPIIAGYIVDNSLSGALLVAPLVSELTEESVTMTGWSLFSSAAISFNESTRTLAIAPKPGQASYYWYSGGQKHISTGDSVTIPDEIGSFLVYYEGDTLKYSKDLTLEEREMLDLCCAEISTIYWRGAGNAANYASDERQYAFMSTSTRSYIKTAFGLKYVYGIEPNNFTIGDGSTNAHSQFSVTSGRLDYATVKVVTPSKPSGLTVFYREGAGDTAWKSSDLSGYSYLVGANNRALINTESNGIWSTTEVSNNDYSLLHICAVNTLNEDHKIISVMGTTEYSTLSTAQKGALEELNTLSLSAWETMNIRPIATIILQSSNTYGSVNKVRVVQTEEGDNFVDWRTTSIAGGSGSGGSGATNFVDLLDTPSNYTNKQGFLLAVNQTETGILFEEPIWVLSPDKQNTYTLKQRVGIGTSTPSTLLDVNGTITATKLVINGDIIQQGSTYSTHAEEVLTKNDLLTLRDGAIAGLAQGEYAGLIAKLYDGTTDGRLIFDNTGTARVGDLGQELPLATRSEVGNISNGNLMMWDAATSSIIDSGYAAADLTNDPYITGMAFDSNTGILNITRSDNIIYSANLDTRYALASSILNLGTELKETHNISNLITLSREGSAWYPTINDDLHRGVASEIDLSATTPVKVKITYPYSLYSTNYQLNVYGWSPEVINDGVERTIENSIQYKSLIHTVDGFEVEFFKPVAHLKFFTLYNTAGVSISTTREILNLTVPTTYADKTVTFDAWNPASNTAVSWGDGTTDNNNTHTYASDSIYTVSVTSETPTGQVIRIYPGNTIINGAFNADLFSISSGKGVSYDPTHLGLITINDILLTSGNTLYLAYININNLVIPEGDEDINLLLTSLLTMNTVTINRKVFGQIKFTKCADLTTINWSQGQVYKQADASAMFYEVGASSPGLNALPTPEGFITTDTTDVHNMFFGTKFNDTPKTLDFSSWDFSNVSTFYRFLAQADGVYEVVGLDGAVTSTTTNISHMFASTEMTTLDISNWDTSNVVNMDSAFRYTKLSVIDLNYINFTNAITIDRMFENISTQPIEILNHTNISMPELTHIDSWMSQVYLTNAFDVSGVSIPKVTRLSNFLPYKALSYNLNDLITSTVTDLSYFASSVHWSSFTSFSMTGWDTSNVTNMKGMFAYSEAYNYPGWEAMDTSNVTDMSGMFEGSQYTYIFVSNTNIQICLETWDMSSVTTVDNMFKYIRIATGVTITLPANKLWNNPSITSYTGAFSNILPEDQARITNWADIPEDWK